MNRLFLIAALCVSFSAQAAWMEKLECKIKRVSTDSKQALLIKTSTNISMKGPHNGERGMGVVSTELLPGYTFTYEKLASGRTDESTLTTKYTNKVIALSSVDEQIESEITNKFLTDNGNYQVSVTCSSKML